MGKKLYKFLIVVGIPFIIFTIVIQNLPYELFMPEKNKDNPIVLTMQELGYDNAQESASFYGKQNYELVLSSYRYSLFSEYLPDTTDKIYLTIMLSECEDEAMALDVLNRKMIEHQSLMRQLNSGYEGMTNLYINAAKDSPERIREIMKNVNAYWQADEAYQSVGVWQKIWLKKGSRVMELDYSLFEFTPERITLISNLFDCSFPQEMTE